MKVPCIGDDIYVPTVGNCFVGGLARVTTIIGDDGAHYVFVENHTGITYFWEGSIAPMQDELKSQFGTERAYSTGFKLPCH